MFAVSRILAPIVFSENCRGALRYAIALASRLHAELTVLHVLEPMVSFDIESDQELEYLEKCRRDWALDEMDKLTFPTGRQLAVKTVTVDGDAATEICAYAKSHDIDLLVMPTHGHGPMRRFLLGSVTAKTLHDCRCAVWTGAHLERAPEHSSIEIRRIVCAVDLGPHSDAVLHWGTGMASAWNAELTVMHVSPCHGDAASQRLAVEAGREFLKERTDALGISAECVVTPGQVGPTVCGVAKQIGAGLMVIGRSHAPGVAGRLRSTAYEITRESPCPVSGV
jgi:nucleotide-binding universal stress UspA family protein